MKSSLNGLRKKSVKPIMAKLDGYNELINYTTDILDMLKSDPICEYIVDSRTGEIIYERLS